MKLRIISDLHIRHEANHLAAIHQGDEDVVACAGDVDNGTKYGLSWLRDRFPDRRIVFVPGNHEYYGEIIADADGDMRILGEALKIDVLINSTVRIDDIEFIGSTLWSNFCGDDPFKYRTYMLSEKYCNDFRLIKSEKDRRLRPFYVEHELFSKARSFLESAIDSNRRQVVVTHFAPALGSVAPEFKNDPATPYFVNDLAELVSRTSLWIHGHTHKAFDYRVGNSRVICNPGGYPGEQGGFNPGLVIEI